MNAPQKIIEAFECSKTTLADYGQWELHFDTHLSSTEYAFFKRVVNALKGRWDKKRQVHQFGYDPESAIARFLETGYLPPKNPDAFFPTPSEIAELMVDHVPFLESCKRILEPSAGTGAIADAVKLRLPNASIECIEVNPEFCGELRQRFSVKCVNFLDVSPSPGFDLVVMNPPFQGKTYQKHIRHAWEFVGPSGSLSSVLPSEFLRDREFRNFVLKYGEIEDIQSVFAGTDVDCHIVWMRKDREVVCADAVNSWIVALDCDVDFYQSIQRSGDLRRKILRDIERLAKIDGGGGFYDEQVVQSLVLHYQQIEVE